ncbi:MAG: hypothetical protein JXQ71_02245 [Verrucomicrobia bacterium]|nr:hypothetical protein [Verrucomicrobiota bacterium]
MNNATCSRLGWVVAALQFTAGAAFGQWTTQTLALQPGWNAVFLEIQPEPAECDALFGGLPVERVWGWNRRFTSVQFIQDASELTVPNPDWLLYLPPTHRLAGEMTLFSLHAGKCYLIKLAQDAAPTNWSIRGKAVVRKVAWLSDSLNLAGFRMPAGVAPTFQQFFSGSTNHLAGPFCRLSAAGAWQQIPATFSMRSGEAFWVRTQGKSEFVGPLDIVLEQSTGLDFGRVLQEQTLRIRNASAAARTVVLTTLPSEAPSSADGPAVAGDVPLSYWVESSSTNIVGWTNLPPVLVRSNLASGAEWAIRLAVRRAGMAPYAAPAGGAGGLYQSLIEVTDVPSLTRVVLPVSAAGPADLSGAALGMARVAGQGGSGALPLQPGLWMGSVVLDEVSQPASFTPLEPQPTPATFQFRVLLHMDSSGTVRLLQKVLQMWQEGTLKPDPQDPARLVVDQPGRFVLLTDESLAAQIPGLTGATLRDGTPVGRRFSTVAFGFRAPQAMGVSGDTLSCTVAMGYDDSLNPFKHGYHPDHDNLDERFEEKLPEGAESHTVTRQIQFQFTAGDPEGLLLAGWGDNQLGGIYRETVTGLHRSAIHCSGRFRLYRASSTPVLNNGL